MRPKQLIICCLFFLKIQNSGNAQGVRQNFANWFTYFGQYKTSARWGLHFDGQFRADDKIERINQSLVRLGGQYYLNPATTLTLGYAFINTYNNSAEAYFTEHRLWQQYMHGHRMGAAASMTHRLRFETRFVEKPATGTDTLWATGYRLRYFNRTLFPLGKSAEARLRPYVAIQNEVFFNIASPDLNENLFDQNRLLLAFVFLHAGLTRLELGYMFQYINPSGNTDVLNHILHFSILQALDLGAQQ